MKILSIPKTLVSVIAVAATFNGYAGDVAAGKAKSVTCAACHGGNGISQIPMYPNLAGQKEEYLKIQLKAFRDGQRQNAIMAPMAAGLSDTDIDNLSAFYASLNPAG